MFQEQHFCRSLYASILYLGDSMGGQWWLRRGFQIKLQLPVTLNYDLLTPTNWNDLPGAYAGIDGGGVSTFLPVQLPTLPSPTPFLPFPSPPLRSRAPLNQLGGLIQRGPRQSPCRKRIWCTLALPESHWWQSFWVFWSVYLTVDRSTFSTN